MKENSGNGSPCPSPEALAKSLQTELSAGERETLIDHVLACPECRVRFDVLREVQAEIRANQSHFRSLAAQSRRELRAARRKALRSDPARIRPGLPRRAWGFAAAGLLLVLIGVTAYSVLFNQSPFKFSRKSADQTLTVLPPILLSDGKTMLLRWEAVPGVDKYQLSVVDEALNPLIEEFGTAARAYVFYLDRHPGVLDPGKTFLLTVQAYDDDGMTIAKASKLFSIR